MSDNPFVAFNVLTVPEQARTTLEERFAARAGEVEKMDGFRHFELLRPVDGTDRYLVYTRWESKAHFDAWVESMAFKRGHAQAGGADEGGAREGGSGEGGSGEGGAREGGAPSGPAATGSEVWTFEAIQMTDADPSPSQGT